MSKNWGEIREKLVYFLKNEAKKKGFDRAVIGISGGVDSALSSALAKEAFSDVLGVILPSYVTSQKSVDDAKAHCKRFGIRYEIISITPMIKAYFGENSDNRQMRIGNFSARVRMAVLYDISFRENALVIGTANKSEIILGYGTHYGDMACALNPLGNLYKTDVFALAKYMGISEEILNKKPSAELFEGQEDEKELGYSYALMDSVMVQMFDKKVSKEKLLEMGFEAELIEFIEYRYKKNRFKSELPLIATI